MKSPHRFTLFCVLHILLITSCLCQGANHEFPVISISSPKSESILTKVGSAFFAHTADNQYFLVTVHHVGAAIKYESHGKSLIPLNYKFKLGNLSGGELDTIHDFKNDLLIQKIDMQYVRAYSKALANEVKSRSFPISEIGTENAAFGEDCTCVGYKYFENSYGNHFLSPIVIKSYPLSYYGDYMAQDPYSYKSVLMSGTFPKQTSGGPCFIGNELVGVISGNKARIEGAAGIRNLDNYYYGLMIPALRVKELVESYK